MAGVTRKILKSCEVNMLNMTNKTYDVLKYIQRIALPAVITFITTILGLLDVQSQTIAVVVGIISAIVTLMGALLQVNYNEYQKLIDGESLEK